MTFLPKFVMSEFGEKYGCFGGELLLFCASSVLSTWPAFGLLLAKFSEALLSNLWKGFKTPTCGDHPGIIEYSAGSIPLNACQKEDINESRGDFNDLKIKIIQFLLVFGHSELIANFVILFFVLFQKLFRK